MTVVCSADYIPVRKTVGGWVGGKSAVVMVLTNSGWVGGWEECCGYGVDQQWVGGWVGRVLWLWC